MMAAVLARHRVRPPFKYPDFDLMTGVKLKLADHTTWLRHVLRGASMALPRASWATTHSPEGTKGSEGMGVVSNNRFDHVLLSILYTFKPSG